MQKKRRASYIGLTLIFLLIGLLCRTPWLRDVYPFDWSAFHHDLFLWLGWVLAVLLVRSKRYIPAWSLPLGNFVGLFLGWRLGDYIVVRNETAIPRPGGNPHNFHYGVLIWLIVVLVLFLVGLVLNWWFKQRRRQGDASSVLADLKEDNEIPTVDEIDE